LARAAAISGDVELTLRIKRDGTIDSVDVVSGHPMLRQAAIESAQRSHFECGGCAEVLTAYSLTYEFQIVATDPPKDCNTLTDEAQAPKLDPTRHNVLVVFANEIWTCDPAVEMRKVRSAKCMYLWKCGYH
jgi:hypothetical protein